jgi:hypothetical protein
MSGTRCLIIIDGGGCQGEAALLSANVAASCELVDYLSSEPDFHISDAQPIADFHAQHKIMLARAAQQIDDLNRALAAKYST